MRKMTRMMMRRMMTKMRMTSVMIIVVDLNPCSARSAKLISIDKCVLHIIDCEGVLDWIQFCNPDKYLNVNCI